MMIDSTFYEAVVNTYFDLSEIKEIEYYGYRTAKVRNRIVCFNTNGDKQFNSDIDDIKRKLCEKAGKGICDNHITFNLIMRDGTSIAVWFHDTTMVIGTGILKGGY